MEIKTCEALESTGYRCLFECVKEQGIEPVMHFIKDVNNISSRDILLRQAIMCGKNDLLALVKRNRDIVRYLRQHDLQGFIFTSQNVLDTLTSLSKDISLLELYLDNAKRLEELNVLGVHFEKHLYSAVKRCDIYKDKEDGKIKYYTDGRIQSMGEISDENECNYSYIPFAIENSDCSFLLEAINTEQGQYRNIFIKNFGFDGTKLPSEEELQSYEVPKQFCLK